jgi:hypothetical protein
MSIDGEEKTLKKVFSTHKFSFSTYYSTHSVSVDEPVVLFNAEHTPELAIIEVANHHEHVAAWSKRYARPGSWVVVDLDGKQPHVAQSAISAAASRPRKSFFFDFMKGVPR